MSSDKDLKTQISDFKDTELTELRALIGDLDRDTASQLNANLYSLYLYRLERSRPRTSYALWPVKDAPADETFYMDDLEDKDNYSGDENDYQDDTRDEEAQTEPKDARNNLIIAFNTYLKRQVYKRIHMDGLEPILELEPHAGQLGADLAFKIHDILHTLPPPSRGPLNWRQLQITDQRVIDKMEKYFPVQDSRTQTHSKEAAVLEKNVSSKNRQQAWLSRFKLPYAPKPYDYQPVTTLKQQLNDSIEDDTDEIYRD